VRVGLNLRIVPSRPCPGIARNLTRRRDSHQKASDPVCDVARFRLGSCACSRLLSSTRNAGTSRRSRRRSRLAA
jgi:hypothetical protein